MLPKMVDFYKWIHQQFSLTKQQAEMITIGDLLRSKKCAQVTSEINSNSFEKRTDQFNKLCGKLIVLIIMSIIIIFAIELTKTLQRSYEVGCNVAPLEDGMLLIDAICTHDTTGIIYKWITLLVKLIVYRLMDYSFEMLL